MNFDADALIERRRLKRRLAIWRAAFVLLLAAGAVAVLSYGLDVADGYVPGSRPHIARVHIDEMIVEDRDRQEALAQIAENPNAKALIVHITSPGGSTFGSEELYLALRKIGESRPVVAVIGTIGTSGGYLAALAGDRIFARESSITGSIGVLFQTTEFSKLMEKVGVSAEAITSGPLKAEPSPFKPLSDAGRQATQSVVNETYGWFRNLVAERRGLAGGSLDSVTDGRIMIGRTAVDLKLVDEIGGEAEAVRWLAREKGVDDKLPVRTVSWGGDEDDWRRIVSGVLGKSVFPERLRLDGLLALWQPER